MASWRWTHGCVEKVALAIALAVTEEHAAGHVYNVGEADPPPWAGWVKGDRARGRVGWRGGGRPRKRSAEAPRLGARRGTVPGRGHRPYPRGLGYREAVPRGEALRKTVEWERANPLVKVVLALFDYAAEDATLAGLRPRILTAEEAPPESLAP